jgi:predicted RNA binding protein YcfA (HicA-like mRNA interferase family)
LKTREIIRRLESEGWVLVRQEGSHKQYKNTNKPDLITVPDHGGTKEPSIGVLNDIKKKTGWK